MDSVEAFVNAPALTTGYLRCLLCRRIQGWITSPLESTLRADEFIPSPDYPLDRPIKGDVIVCGWCQGPCTPVPSGVSHDYLDIVGWKVLIAS